MHTRHFFISSFLAVLCLGFSSCDKERPQSNQSKSISGEQDKKPKSMSKIEVWTFARDFVRDRLKSPSSSSFGGIFSEYQNPDRAVIELTENAWGVYGWVDADNSFGANLRSDFYLEIQLKGNAATLTYFEFEGQEPMGESILSKLGEVRNEEQKAASAERLSDSIVARKTAGSREFFLIKTDLKTQDKTSFVSQLGKDLQSSSKKLKLFAWIYNQADEYQGCLVISKKESSFTEDSFSYPDPFRPDGYFGFRDWSSPQGQFKLKAKFVGSGNGRVLLVDENDKNRDVEISKLSEIDQEWIKNAPDLLPK